jgi:hypothetical protein
MQLGIVEMINFITELLAITGLMIVMFYVVIFIGGMVNAY